MSLEPNDVPSWINVLKPYITGGLGAVASYLYDVIEGKRKLLALVLLFWAVLGAMTAAWADDELTLIAIKYDIVIHARGPILFFLGGAAVLAYPKLREASTNVLVGFAERLRKVAEKFK